MTHPRNPTRRSRNIGTAKQGHGADNELTIPESWADDRRYFERLVEPREYTFHVHGCRRVALVEEPAAGHFYGCTPQDLKRLLELVPADDVDDLNLFLFRHPTKKQRLLSSVWGRFLYYACPGEHQGSAICFESQTLEPILWSKSVNPETARELRRLTADGHEVVTCRRNLQIRRTPESFRNTVLFRTALHEIGHYVDWLRSDLEVDGTFEEEEAASRAFSTKTRAMKEDFAHRYASEMASALTSAGSLPYETVWNDSEMSDAGIERVWFA